MDVARRPWFVRAKDLRQSIFFTLWGAVEAYVFLHADGRHHSPEWLRLGSGLFACLVFLVGLVALPWFAVRRVKQHRLENQPTADDRDPDRWEI